MKNIPLRIVYEDQYLIVIEKREGLLSVGTSRGKEEVTAHSLLNNYVRNTAPHNTAPRNSASRNSVPSRGFRREQQPRIFIVHRLDRETSGLMVFAKSEEIKHALQDNWENAVTHRGYVAVVNGTPEGKHMPPQGRIRTWLKENSAFIVYSSPKDNGGQLAITNYKVLAENPSRRKTLMELQLDTGRKNQIRVHMQEMGMPIFGDKKYYGQNPAQLAENKKARRLYLHAHILNFIHPVTGREMKFTTGIPRAFREEV